MKGILFKPDMIKAIVEGRKTVTRRMIKPQPHYEKGVLRWDKGLVSINMDDHSDLASPYARYQVGETVYIKEAWALRDDGRQTMTRREYDDIRGALDIPELGVKFQSPLFMPEKYARYFIRILYVSAEKLQEISLAEIQSEGIPDDRATHNAPIQREKFRILWDSINKPPYDWESNPWVWRYEFKLVANKRGRE